MKSRCLNPSTPGFHNYGGRGIRICSEWVRSFSGFFRDVGAKPGPGYSIDRFPNKNGDYEPGNVRWATQTQQMRNTRYNSVIVFHGESLSIAEAAERVGLKPNTVIYRLRRGWTPENALLPGNFRGQHK